MIFKQSARTDPEQIFIVCRNTSGAAISAGVPVAFEVDAVSDGNSVSICVDAEMSLFAGIADAAMADDAYGLVQVYGYRASAYGSCASGGNVAGTPLMPVTGQLYLTDTTSSAAGAAGFKFVSLFEAVAASAAYSTLHQWKVFIRAL